MRGEVDPVGAPGHDDRIARNVRRADTSQVREPSLERDGVAIAGHGNTGLNGNDKVGKLAVAARVRITCAGCAANRFGQAIRQNVWLRGLRRLRWWQT